MSNVTKCDQKLIVEAVGDVVVELEIKFLVCNSVSRTLIHFSFGLTQTLEPFFLVTMISVWRHCPEIGITSIFWMTRLLMGEEVVRMQRHHCLGEACRVAMQQQRAKAARRRGLVVILVVVLIFQHQ